MSLSAVSCCPLLGWGEALSPGVARDTAGWESSPSFPPMTERRVELGWLPGLVAGLGSRGGQAPSLPCAGGGAAGPELRAGGHCHL